MVLIRLLRFRGIFGLRVCLRLSFSARASRTARAARRSWPVRCDPLIVNSHDFPSSPRLRLAYQRSPNRTQKGKRRIKTILDQFRNTHARFSTILATVYAKCICKLYMLLRALHNEECEVVSPSRAIKRCTCLLGRGCVLGLC